MTQKIEFLLKEVSSEIKNETEKKILRGEVFNLFSVLKMETSENQTHSAFIGELLNPNGSHHFGDAFLKLFLEAIFDGSNDIIDTSSTKLILEKGIGKVDLKNKRGGRIDIYLEDKFGKSVTIENKINAAEQALQIRRYFNYNTGKNTVIYLTKFGDISNTADDLKPHEEYFPISYSETIIDWLIKCQMKVTDFPILRETIKQYIILIKKITYTMNSDHDEKLRELILSNLESAQTISNKVMKFKTEAFNKLRNSVFNLLKEKLSHEYDVILGPKIQVQNSSIWIRPKDWEYPQVYFGIEGFSGAGHKGQNLFYGLANAGEIAEKQSWVRYKDFWAEITVLDNIEIGQGQLALNLHDGNFLLKIIRNNEESKAIIRSICSDLIQFISNYQEAVSEINLKLKRKVTED